MDRYESYRCHGKTIGHHCENHGKPLGNYWTRWTMMKHDVASGKLLRNELERSTMLFLGKRTLDWAIVNSYVESPEGITGNGISIVLRIIYGCIMIIFLVFHYDSPCYQWIDPLIFNGHEFNIYGKTMDRSTIIHHFQWINPL